MGRSTSFALVVLLAAAACSREFDSQRWKSADSDERGRMFGDLVTKHALVGMSLDEVIALLGKPQWDEQMISYRIGPLVDDPCCPATGRLTIRMLDGLASQFFGVRGTGDSSRVMPFEPARFRTASVGERLAMLDGVMALEDEWRGRPAAEVEAMLGPPDEQSREVMYPLSRGKNGIFGVFHQRQLSLKVDRRGVVTESIDHQYRD